MRLNGALAQVKRVIPDILGFIFVGLFLYGCYRLIKRSGPELGFIILIVYFLEFVTAIFKQWPFGDARSNIFSLFLLYPILVYGAYCLFLNALKKSEATKILAIGLLIATAILLFPRQPIQQLVDRTSSYDQAFTGVQANAVYIAKRSKRSDLVLVSNVIGPPGFDFYYRYSDYTSKYRQTDAKNLIYAYTSTNPLILPSVRTIKPRNIWVVIQDVYPGYEVDNKLTYLENNNYHLIGQFIYGEVETLDFVYLGK